MKKYVTGTFIFADLSSADAGKLREFYQAVAGWSSTGVPMKDGDTDYEDYMMNDAEGNPVGGVCYARGTNHDVPKGWMMYIQVDNAEQRIEDCKKLGGEVVKVARKKDGSVYYAMLRDPEGNAFGIGDYGEQPGAGPAAKAAIQISKPAAAVFEAIVDPEQMKHYFISSSTGRMEAGASLTWRFPEFDINVPVRVKEVEKNALVTFGWDVNDHEMTVTIRLEPFGDGAATVVKIEEASAEGYDPGQEWLIGNTEGWANFLSCMKAWLEYGVHLRVGAFDFRKEG